MGRTAVCRLAAPLHSGREQARSSSGAGMAMRRSVGATSGLSCFGSCSASNSAMVSIYSAAGKHHALFKFLLQQSRNAHQRYLHPIGTTIQLIDQLVESFFQQIQVEQTPLRGRSSGNQMTARHGFHVGMQKFRRGGLIPESWPRVPASIDLPGGGRNSASAQPRPRN